MYSFESVCQSSFALYFSDWRPLSDTLNFVSLDFRFLFPHLIIFSLLLTAADFDI